MRRSASEIIGNLEMRVARLEKQSKNSSWKNSVKAMTTYYEREVGKGLLRKGIEGLDLDVRTPSDTRSLTRQHTNTATLVFILNDNAVYLDAYEHQNMFGKTIFGFNLMSEDGRKVLAESPKNPMPMDRNLVSKILEMLEEFAPIEKSATQLELPFHSSGSVNPEILVVRNTPDELRFHVKKEIAKEIFEQIRIAQKDLQWSIRNTRKMFLSNAQQYLDTSRYSEEAMVPNDLKRPPKVDPRDEMLEKLCRELITCKLHRQSRQGKEWAVIECGFNRDLFLDTLKNFSVRVDEDDNGEKYYAGHYNFSFEGYRHKPSLDRIYDDMVGNVEVIFDDFFVSGPKGFFEISNDFSEAYRLASRR